MKLFENWRDLVLEIENRTRSLGAVLCQRVVLKKMREQWKFLISAKFWGLQRKICCFLSPQTFSLGFKLGLSQVQEEFKSIYS